MVQRTKNPKTKSWDTTLKITDFGFACQYDPKSKFKLNCGSDMYKAPEIEDGCLYDNACDVWSFGVVAYMILTFQPPVWKFDDSFRRVCDWELI